MLYRSGNVFAMRGLPDWLAMKGAA